MSKEFVGDDAAQADEGEGSESARQLEAEPAEAEEGALGSDPAPPGARDDADPDALGDDDLAACESIPQDLFLGGEASVPAREFGPPIESKLPEVATTNELRELERRVRARLTPAFPMEQSRQLPLAFFWKRYRHFAMRDRADVVDEFGRDPIYSARVQPVLDFLYRRYFRVSCEGLEHVPNAGRALLVANHSGTLPYDGAILMHALRHEHPAHRDLRPLAEDFVFHFPYLGTFFNRIGAVRACQDNARRLLAADQLIAVFPEGMKGIGKLYKDRYKLQRFGRGGFVKLALRTGSPIVPVAIVGAEETNPMLAKVTWLTRSLGIPYLPITPTFPALGPLGLLPLPTKWFLHFGAPLDFTAEYGPEAAGDRILVNRLAELVRSGIQAMIDDILGRRESILLG